jgi:hypothetical protein
MHCIDDDKLETASPVAVPLVALFVVLSLP